ncbi:MAG: hypothetical protein ABIR18_12275 [Chitinophagaceae bacterium]
MKNNLLISFLAVLTVTGCESETSFTKEKEEVQTSLEDFYSDNRSNAQSFSVPASSGGMTTTSGGIKIYFPGNGFVTKDGALVNGDVSVNVKEVLTPYEMIFNNMPTMAGGLPLESGGEFQINVTKNSQELILAPGKFLRIQMPKNNSANMNGMQVFNGVEDANGNVDWRVNTTPGNFVVGDSTLFAGSSLFSDNVGWINCDKFYNDPTVTFSVYPANAPSNDSTNVFVHLTGRNTVVKMSWTQGLSYFRSDKLLALPSTIIGISVKNGQLYASLTPVNVRDGESVTMNFSKYTEKQLKEKLKTLH